MKRPDHPRSEPTIAERLRRDILVGVHHPGQWLKQAELIAAYATNQFEVRMAMHDLKVRGLLEHVPNKGYRVSQPTPRKRAETAAVRIVLEMAALPAVVAAATARDIAELRDLAAQFDEATVTGDQGRQRDLNYHFHRRFYALAGNATLSELINDLRENSAPGPREGWRTHAGLKASSLDHIEMLAALERRDLDALCAAVERHLRRNAPDGPQARPEAAGSGTAP